MRDDHGPPGTCAAAEGSDTTGAGLSTAVGTLTPVIKDKTALQYRSGFVNALLVGLPVELHILHDVGMDAFSHRAGKRRSFEDGALLFAQAMTIREGKFYVNTSDPAWLCTHYFQDAHFGTFDVPALCAGSDAHNSKHTRTQCAGYEVGGRKTFAFSVIIYWGIRFYYGAGTYVGGGCPQFAIVYYLCGLHCLTFGCKIKGKNGDTGNVLLLFAVL